MQLLSVVIWRSKQTGQSYGFGFLNFADHSTAGHVLHSYNGQKMPNADRDFRLQWRTRTQQPPPESHHFNLNWVTQQQQDPPQGHIDDNSDDYAIFVGDLAFDVTPFMLQHLFKTRYPSVKSAKVIYDKETGHSKGYGFVAFGDANEHSQAMTEMNGAYCSTRPMRIGPAPNKRGAYTYPPKYSTFASRLPFSFTFLTQCCHSASFIHECLAALKCGWITNSYLACIPFILQDAFGG
jgi:RNA recognition motif-containing protein